jgi:energy-coupling factor transporter ATP-binding protein EcfA2
LSALFAGRHQEIDDCAAELAKSSILVLHGRTGCGKSSFLRAGVKPKLERTMIGARFEGDVSEFEVIRSTQLPLRELANRIVAAAFEVKRLVELNDIDESGPLGELRQFIDDEDVERLLKILAKGEPDQDALIDEICEGKNNLLLDLVVLIGDLLADEPIFVIDQAEEIFTLADAHQNTELGDDEKERLAKQYKRERRYYFDFLKDFVEKDPSCTLVISLRTEYKGLFDDNISRDKHPGPKLRGFYLKDLDKKGLAAAIIRPTLTRDQIPEYELTGLSDDLVDFEFSIEQEVVDQLVDALESDEVPAGGILPTMQVACLRLWRMALAARRGKQRFKITRNHYQQLGQIQNQIEEYLAESLENCSVEIDWPVGDGR